MYKCWSPQIRTVGPKRPTKYTAPSRTVHQTQKVLYTEEVHTEDSVFMISTPCVFTANVPHGQCTHCQRKNQEGVRWGGVWRFNCLRVQADIQCLVEPCGFLNCGPGPDHTVNKCKLSTLGRGRHYFNTALTSPPIF